MRQQGMVGRRGVRADSCRAWLLPTDETCAGIARGLFRNAVAHLGFDDDVLDDAVLITSELAANTLHASAAARTGGAREGGPPVPSNPELWLYLRGLGMRRELVCKVFDCYRGWLQGPPLLQSGIPAQANPFGVATGDAGRGLQIVRELSGGRWGHHLTRARLGGGGVRGKAVWFAVPAPFAHARLADVTGLRAYTRSADVTAARRREQISAGQAARELKAMLDERGFSSSTGSGIRLIRSGEPGSDMSVLSVCRGLTLRFRSGSVSLTSPGGVDESWSYADLVEAAEQTIRRYEELDPSRPETLSTASRVG